MILTVQPVTRTPLSITSLWALGPLNEGNSDGCMLTILPYL